MTAPPRFLSHSASGQLAVALVFTGLIGVGLVLLSGGDPVLAYARLFEGAFGGRYEIGETIVRAIPLAVVALGVAPALRGGIFTVGSEGQLAIGALVATAVLNGIGGGPAFALLPIGMLAGAVGGAMWAMLPAMMRAYAKVNEILSTLLLNYLAGFLVLWLLRAHLAIPEPVATPRSAALQKAAMIPNLLEGTRLHWGVAVALGGALLLAWWTNSVRGLTNDIFATNPMLAARMGLSDRKAIMSNMLIAGAAAGVAGWMQVAGLLGTLYPSVAGGLGFTGVLVALLGNLKPVGILCAALFFGALASGSEGMQAGTGVPAAIASVFEGIILLAAALMMSLRHRRIRRLAFESIVVPVNSKVAG